MIDYTISKRADKAQNVVLIHGLFGDKNNLNILKRDLTDTVNVMSIDLPDHGKSAHTSCWQFSSVVQQLSTLLNETSFAPCAIVGHSLGGKVAMAMALTYPEQVNKLVVADISPVKYPPRHDNVFKALNAVEQAQVDSRTEATKILNSILTEPGVAQFLLKSFKLIDNQWQWLFNLSRLQQDYANIIDWPFTNQVYNGDVLFIKGENSDYIIKEHQPIIQQQFPNASYKVINGTGHWLHAEKPLVFNRLVLRMLDN